MCGLIFAKRLAGNKPVNELVHKQYEKQRSRGHDGFGIFDNDRHHLIHTPKEKKIRAYLRNRPSEEIMFHHRYPTSTANTASACHPFDTKDFFSVEKGYSGTRYILTHNGVLSNENSLKKEHEDLGIRYQSVQNDGRFNDSESLLWDMALVIEGKKKKLDAAGSIAFIMLAKNDKKGDNLYFGHNSRNPLILKLTDDLLFLSSAGEGTPVETDQLYRFSYKDNVLYSTKNFKIPTYIYTPTYEHHRPSQSPLTGETTAPIIQVPSVSHDWVDQFAAEGDSMYFHQPTSVLYLKDNNGDWVTFDDAADQYAQQKALEKELKDPNVTGDKVANAIAEARSNLDKTGKELITISGLPITNIEDYKTSDEYEEEFAEMINNILAEEEEDEEQVSTRTTSDEDVSPVVAGSKGLKVAKSDVERQIDVHKRFRDYLELTDGMFQKAYNIADKDLSWMREEYAEQLAQAGDNKDLMYEIRVTESVMDVMIISDDWKDEGSSHPRIGKKETTMPVSITAAVEQVEQTRLQLMPGVVLHHKEEQEPPISDEQISDFRKTCEKVAAKYKGGE